MCKEDIREGRRKYTSVRAETIAAGETRAIVKASPERTHITFGNGNASLAIRPTAETTFGTDHFECLTTLPHIEFDIETHGSIVTDEWVAKNGGGAATTILVMETFWSDPDRPFRQS